VRVEAEGSVRRQAIGQPADGTTMNGAAVEVGVPSRIKVFLDLTAEAMGVVDIAVDDPQCLAWGGLIAFPLLSVDRRLHDS
jgi:hypothetical protein